MNGVLWLASYIGLLVLEISVFPQLFGAGTPSLTVSGLILGIASLRFLPGMGYAGLAGLFHDIVLPGLAVSRTLFHFALFFIMRFFTALSQWDAPLERIAALLVGLLAVPLGWLAASAAGQTLFDVPLRTIGWQDLASSFSVREVVFVALWVSVFSVITLRRFKRRRLRALTHL